MTKPPLGRPEKPIPDDADPLVAAVAQALRGLRHGAGLSLRELSQRSNYAVATLSAAASGAVLPRWELVEAYARGCEAQGDIDKIKKLWEDAARAKIDAGTRGAKQPLPAPADAGAGDNLPHAAEAQTSAEPLTRRLMPRRQPSNTPSKTAPAASSFTQIVNRTISPPNGETTPTPVASTPTSRTTAKVTHAARSRTHPVISRHLAADSPVASALTYSSTPEHFAEMMRALQHASGMSVRDLVVRARREGHAVSKSGFSEVLQGQRLPSVKTLHAFLTVTGCEAEHWELWHRTLIRLQIAQLVSRQHRPKRHMLIHPARGAGQVIYLLVLLGLLMLLGLQSFGLLPPTASDSSPQQLTVFNLVTDGPERMREDDPIRLSNFPASGCHARECSIPGPALVTGMSVNAVCQTSGPRVTNRSGPGSGENPGTFASSLWYKIALPDGRQQGYLSEVWVAPSDRGGRGLPHCLRKG